jgi:hypothetical protein
MTPEVETAHLRRAEIQRQIWGISMGRWPTQAMKISVVPAQAGTPCRSNGFPLARE